MNTTPEYYKPQPQPPAHDPAVWVMIAPLTVYSLGIILYGADAFTTETHAAVTLGSWLMIVGGEANSITTAIETYRKRQAKTALRSDDFALWVSLLATMGTLFVTYTKVNTVEAWWYDLALAWGPLVLLLFSVLDATLSGAQIGGRVATYEQRLEAWHDAAHTWQMKVARKAAEAQPPATVAQPVAQLVAPEVDKTQPDDLRAAIVAQYVNDGRATQTQVAQVAGCSRQYVSRVLRNLEAAGAIKRNGQGVEVLV